MRLKDAILGFKFSLSYFSIIPIKFNINDDLTKRSIMLFMLLSLPFVGVLLTLPLAYLSSFSDSIFLYLLLAVSYPILYGFIHTEAVIDTIDAIYAKHSGKDPYRVIKEPLVGALGVLWGVVFLIVKLSAIVNLLCLGGGTVLVVLALSSRVALLVVIYNLEFYSTFLEMLKSSLSKKALLLGVAFYAIPLYYFGGLNALTLLISAILLSILVAKFIKSQLSFANGDTLGTTLEITELILLIALNFLL